MAELPAEVTCTRCGTPCLDYRQVGEERICILCIGKQARLEERAACLAVLERQAEYEGTQANELARQRGREVDVRRHRERAKYLKDAARLVAGDGRYRDGRK